MQSSEACLTAVQKLQAGDSASMRTWIGSHLFGHVLPFWERHAIDEKGGLLTCIGDAGEIHGTEKWLWSQWRAVWVFSRIYNRLDRDPRWLDRARHIADFAARGWDSDANGWALLLSREGKIVRGYESIYVDGFAIYGLLELYKACGDDEILRLARRTADAALLKLDQPYDRIPHFPYPIPRGTRPQGIPMIFSLKLAELGAFVGEERYLDAAAALSEAIFRDFYRPKRDMIVERIREGGGEAPGPEGTAVIPGHVIENMWFQIHVEGLLGKRPGSRPELAEEACRLTLRHLELGWDPTCGGGILLAVDADGRSEVGWSFAESKLWWPHTEALYSLLLGWKLTRRPVFLEWYGRVWDYSLKRFADWENGEWRQKLQRDGSPLTEVVALPVKDPFHLPRSLILQLELLDGANPLHPARTSAGS